MAAVSAEGVLKLSALLAQRKARKIGDGDLS
jgi:hypothetical protein